MVEKINGTSYLKSVRRLGAKRRCEAVEKKQYIIPLHKKGDKKHGCNYKSISLLNTAYKVFSKVLLSLLRKLCGPVRNTKTDQWCRKYNQELKEELKIVTINGFIKSQRIKSLGYVIRRNTDAKIKTVLNKKPEAKKPRDRPRKRWMDVVEKDLEDHEMEN